MQPLHEGGAYGHLMHPYEDFNMSFKDLKELITLALSASFTEEHCVTEKIDGLNLLITWKDGELRAARNKSHIKNSAKKSLNFEELTSFFSSKDSKISDVFISAFVELSNHICELTQSDKDIYFKNGNRFLNLEILTPNSENIIPYGLNAIVLHSILEYDNDGNVISEEFEGGVKLAAAISNSNAYIHNTFYIKGPIEIKFTNQEVDNRIISYIDKINILTYKYNLTDDFTIRDYIIAKGKELLSAILEKDVEIKLTDYQISGLIYRLFNMSNSYSYTIFKRELGDNFTKWFVEFETTKKDEFKREILKPIQQIIINVGCDVLQNISNILSANSTENTQKIKNELEKTIEFIKQNPNKKAIDALNFELERISSAGGLDKIIPSEGIVFKYKDKVYKFTGLFAPINQIRNILTKQNK